MLLKTDAAIASPHSWTGHTKCLVTQMTSCVWAHHREIMFTGVQRFNQLASV